MTAPIEVTESRRREALRRYEILDTPSEDAFDALVQLAANMCGAPVALMTLVDEERLWFKARVGLDVSEVPRKSTLCDATVAGRDILVVSDTHQDSRFAEAELVVGPPFIRFYAGMPLVTRENAAIGTLCVIDHAPRDLTSAQHEALRVLARQIVAQLELRLTLTTLERTVEARRQAEEALAEREEHFRGLVEASADAIVRTDSSLKVVFANHRAADLFGYERAADLVGKSAEDLSSPAAIDLVRIRAEMAQRLGILRNIEHPMRRRDGSVFPGELSVSCTYDSEGQVTSFTGIVRDVTERKRSEAALKESEAQFRTLCESAPIGIFQTDAQGATTYINPLLARQFGVSQRVERGDAWQDQIHPEDRDRVIADWIQVASCAGSYHAEHRILRAEGEVRWVTCRASPTQDENGRCTGYVGMVEDCTERQLGENALLRAVESEQQYAMQLRLLAEAALAINSGLSVERVLEVLTEQARVIIGAHEAVTQFCPEGDYAGAASMRSVSELYATGPQQFKAFERPRLGALVGRLNRPLRLTRQQAENHPELEIESDETRTALLGCLAAPLSGRDGRILGVILLNHRYVDDFTANDESILVQLAQMASVALENSRLFQMVQESEERHRLLVERIPDVVWTADEYGNTLFISPNVEQVYGLTPDEIYERGYAAWMGRIHPDDFDMVAESYQRLFSREGVFDVEFRFQRLDGSWIWLQDRAMHTYLRNGQLLADGLFTDITARKRAEESLRQSEANYRSMVKGAGYGFFRTLQNGTLLDVNPALVKMLGYDSEAELLAVNMALIMPIEGEIRTRMSEMFRTTGRFDRVDVKCKRRDGAVIELRLSGRRVAEAGDLSCFEVMAENVTERHALEGQLRQAQKMEAIGQLAGGVAHDFNNLLTAMLGFSELLLEDIEEGDSRRADVLEIQRAAERGATLTRQLLAFSRRQLVQPQPVDVNTVVSNIERIVRRLIGEHIELNVRMSPDLGTVCSDPTQLELVVLNLAVNARDAMGDGGILTIDTEEIELDESYAQEHVGVKAGRYVRLAVSDTGCGMDQEVRDHMFEPFFTTKERGRGTGLGLATVYGIVNQSGGHIRVYSEPSHGTSFQVFLPLSGVRSERMAPRPEEAKVAGGKETILLVEDEDAVRSLAGAVLKRGGYQVYDVSNGAEALMLAERLEVPIDLLVTDMVMPGMSGRELVAKLSSQRPEMRVLFMSGYTNAAVVNQGVLEKSAAFLQKPFTPDGLSRMVRAVCDAPTSTPS